MARLNGVTSNSVFEVLEDWDEQLKSADLAEVFDAADHSDDVSDADDTVRADLPNGPNLRGPQP